MKATKPMQNQQPEPAAGFRENTVWVNPPASLPAQRRRGGLSFAVAAPPVFAAAGNATIRVSVYCGDSANCMFSVEDCETPSLLGTLACKGFETGQEWTRNPAKGTAQCSLIRKEENAPGGPAPADGLPLVWHSFCSTAAEGMCTVMVTLLVSGKPVAVADFSFFKIPALPYIHSLEAKPASGYPGQEIKLEWRVSGATEGYLLPGGQALSMQGTTSTHAVKLDPGEENYQLLVSNGFSGAYRSVNVYTVPPRIAFFGLSREGGTAKAAWETHFAEKDAVELSKEYRKKGGYLYEIVGPSTTAELPPETRLISLRCKNELATVSQRLLLFPPGETARFFLEMQEFKNHSVVRIEWETGSLQDLAIRVYHTSSTLLTTEKQGSWEQAYPKPAQPVYPHLSSTCAVAAYRLKNGQAGKEEVYFA